MKKNLLNMINFIVNSSSSLTIRLFSTDSNNKFIPWNVTPAMLKAQLALKECYRDRANRNPMLSNFLEQECKFLLHIKNEESNIPINIFNKDNIEFVALTDKFTMKSVKTFVTKAGCYAFFDKQSGDLIYIGSNTDYVTRLMNHYKDIKKRDSRFYKEIKVKGGFDKYLWTPVLPFTNYVVQYQRLGHNLTPFDREVLKFVTQFHARRIEQALISYFLPCFNESKQVTFSFSWNYVEQKGIGRPVECFTQKGIELNFSSLKEARMSTGISSSYILNVCNCQPIPYFVYSTLLDDNVHFVVKHRDVQEKPVFINESNTPDLTGFDFNTLPESKVSVLSQDKKWLGLDYVYNGPTVAAKALGINHNKPSVYVNKSFLFYSSILDRLVYLVTKDRSSGYLQNASKQIKVYDLTDKTEPKLFASQKEAAQAYNLSVNQISKLIKQMKPHNNYLFKRV